MAERFLTSSRAVESREEPMSEGSEQETEKRGRPGEGLGQTVVDFLSSVGRPTEASMYLSLFRSLPRGRFAVVAVSGEVLSESLHSLTAQLRLLLALGLYPVLAAGFDAEIEQDALEDFRLLLEEADVPAELCQAEASAIELALSASRVPLVRIADTGARGAAALEQLVVAMAPRKVVVLRSRGGVGPQGGAPLEIEPGHVLRTNRGGISALNVTRDMSLLLSSGVVTEEERDWLGLGERLLRALSLSGVTRSTVSYASPHSLLRELLTVKGEGTLLKLGSVISEEAVTTEAMHRIERLLRESFARTVRPEFFSRPMKLLLIEQHDRGLALLQEGVHGDYLSKFAVLPVARGEGLGQDLWWEIRKRTNCFYWRSRPDNPINGWYRTVCDGMQRTEHWRVFWCGVDAAAVPTVIGDALLRPYDFE